MTTVNVRIAAAPAVQDALSLITVTSPTVAENTGTMTFDVSRTADGQGIIAYDYRTVDGTAVAYDDYEPQMGSAWIAAGETDSYNIVITNDAIGESSETFDFEVFNVRFIDP